MKNEKIQHNEKETMKEKSPSLASKAKEKAGELKKDMKHGMDEAKTKASHLKEDIKEGAHKAKEKIASKAEDIKEKHERKKSA